MVKSLDLKKKRCAQRQFRVRAKLKAVAKNSLRMSVFKSNRHFFAQLIDDKNSTTLLSASSLKLADSKKSGKEIATIVGTEFGKKIVAADIKQSVYLDRGPYLYHGRIAAFAQGVRDQGVDF